MTKKVVRKKEGKRKPANGDYPEKYDALIHYTLRYDPSATEPYCRCAGCKTNVIELLVIDHKKKRTKKEKGLALVRFRIFNRQFTNEHLQVSVFIVALLILSSGCAGFYYVMAGNA